MNDDREAALIPCSVNMLTRNSAKTLDTALQSLKRFRQIVIADGRSSDTTIAIAATYNATIIEQDLRYCDSRGALIDYAGARAQMLYVSTEAWVLYLDSDEIMTDAACDKVALTISTGEDRTNVGGYFLRAAHVRNGREIGAGSVYPIRHLRLLRKAAVSGYAGPVHEKPQFLEGYEIRDLDAVFLIPLPDLRILVPKWWRYTLIRYRDARGYSVSDARRHVASHRSSVRWLLRGWIRSLRTPSVVRTPTRYEVTRLIFEVVQWLVVSVARSQISFQGRRTRANESEISNPDDSRSLR